MGVADEREAAARPARRRWRRAGIVLAVGSVLFVLSVYRGWAPDDPSWRAPLDFPGRAEAPAWEPDQFTSAEVCGGCHQRHYAEWKGSAMARSAELSAFLIDLYEASLDIRGAPRDDVIACLRCHAPLSVLGAEPDLEVAGAMAREGITCDVCHTAVAAHPNDAPAMIEWDPTGPKLGPFPAAPAAGDLPVEEGLGDDAEASDSVQAAASPFHETARSPLAGSSDLCGACHMSLWPSSAVPIDWTFAEWQRSPYFEQGVSCQDCHMETYEGIAAPGAPVRPDLHRHGFPGGADVAFVQRAARLTAEALPHFAGQELVVAVENHGAGHAFPTGNANFPVVELQVRAFDAAGAEVFAGDRQYRLTYVDADGVVCSDPTMAVALVSDTTLQPLEIRRERFYLPRRIEARSATATLVYRRWNSDVVDDHAGIARELAGRFVRRGVLVHRLIARLGDLDYGNLDRVRAIQPITVDAITFAVPPPVEIAPAPPRPEADR